MAPAPPTDTLVPLAATLSRPTHTPASSIGVPATAAPTAVPTTRPAVATAIGYTTQDAQGKETGTLADNTPLMPIKGISAGGSYSTVEDLLNFSNALLGYRLPSPESIELLLAGKVEVREGS